MKVEDFRVGNLIIEKEFPNITSKVEAISFTGFIVGSYNDSLGMSDILPIELNEEWLKRMGFEKSNGDEAYGMEYFHRGISLYFKDGKFRFYTHRTNRAWTEFDFVHEVMNLFHSLTGHELEIK